MGFRQGAALSSVCFLLGQFFKFVTVNTVLMYILLSGVLFISFNADYRVLYQPPTDASVDDAMHYYKTFYNAPKAVQVCISVHVGSF